MIRGVTFVSIGTLIGFFASRNRAMLEQFRILAERDVLTGQPNTRAFEAGDSSGCSPRKGTKATFGWAVHPQEGENALALYRAASERLYARKVMRGYLRTARPHAV